MDFVPLTNKDKEEMLAKIGIKSIDDLFQNIGPRFNKDLNISSAMTEMEVKKHVTNLSEKNSQLKCFRGAGCYNHYVPSAINHILLRGEFYTAYTPYQPEVSQGTLQAIYEFQTYISALTGMEVANASMYDGQTAVAESILLAVNETQRQKVYVHDVNFECKQVVQTYAEANGFTTTDSIDENTACIVLQNPTFKGSVEDVKQWAEKAHAVGALLIVYVADPTSLALLEAPGVLGADIVVGELQSFGNGMFYGGPWGAFMAISKKYMKKIPGRLCGRTVDNRGNEGFILTLQAREQHIRREKATSNICTNQALNALAASIYLSLLGREGLRNVAKLSYQRAHQLLEALVNRSGVQRFELVNKKPFYNEFTVKLQNSNTTIEKINKKLEENGFLGGLDLGNNEWLLACTEQTSEEDINKFCSIVMKEVA